MGVVTNIRDRLTNVMSGKGTTADRRVWDRYAFIPENPSQCEAAYRSSWLVRKIVDVPALDMTRAWRDWQTDAPNIEKIEAEEKRLLLKEKCKRALILSRLYGGGALLLGTNDSDPMRPLNPASVKKDGLVYVHVVSRWQLALGAQRLDPADPWVNKPEYFELNTNPAKGELVRIHPSRVVEFIGQRVPEGSYLSSNLVGSWFWGDPIMQSIGQAVKNADLAQDGFAALIDEAKIDILKVPDLINATATDEGASRFLTRLQAVAQGKSTWRMLAIDALEDWQQKQMTWAGIPDTMDAFLLVVAGAADIPMTRLLGQSPRGLQSTGDGEERDYQSMIKARQDEILAPALDRIDELLIPSALGSTPSDVYYAFGPLQEANEKDSATVEFQLSQTIQNLANTGLLPDQALAAIAKNRIIESGRWPGSETAFEEAEAAIAADPSLDPLAQPEPVDPSALTQPFDPNAAGTAHQPSVPADPSPAKVKVGAHTRGRPTRKQRLAQMQKRGTVTADQAAILMTDAAPRSLYVSRKLVNADAVIAWAKGQGIDTTVPAAEMHVTLLYSHDPVDWMKMGSAWDEDANGQLRVAPGGPRMLDTFGNLKEATVLLFNSSSLCWRHEDMVSKGASHDYEDFCPHITITYDAPAGFDPTKAEPYQGELIFGPEIFAEVAEDWKSGIEEE